MDNFPPQSAIAALRDALHRYKQELSLAMAQSARIAPLKELIRTTEEAIRQLETGELERQTSDVNPGEFSGMRLLEAISSYLERLRRAGKPSIKVRGYLEAAMVTGGAIMQKKGKGEERAKSFAQVKPGSRYRILVNFIRDHPERFRYDGESDTVSLIGPQPIK